MDQTDVIVALVGLAGIVIAALVAYRVGELGVRQDLEIQQLKSQQDRQTQQLKFQGDLQIEYDQTLRDHRIESYKGLLTHLRQLSNYSEPQNLTFDKLSTLANTFTDWYYNEGGGLFVTARTRAHYLDLQDGINIVLRKQAKDWRLNRKQGEEVTAALKRKLDRADEKWECPPQLIALAKATIRNAQNTDAIPTAIVNHLRELGSDLRTSMTNDLMARQAAIRPNSEAQSA